MPLFLHLTSGLRLYIMHMWISFQAMVWKVVTNADAGDADHFRGDDLDKISQLFSGSDVDSVKLSVDYIDLNPIPKPASPSSGYIRLFMDTADNKMMIKRSNGDAVIVE
jgi:hypothetical protein